MKTILMPEPGQVVITEMDKPVPREGEALLNYGQRRIF